MTIPYVIAGLGNGDEGKGSIVDFLTEQRGAKTVVRYNGGPQAAHHVVRNGHTHCFSQFGSGTLVDGTNTFLSRFMLIDPLALTAEEHSLRQAGVHDGFERLSVDEDCIVITPMQRIVGQMRELAARYGSCGRGVGETMRDSRAFKSVSLRAADLQDAGTLESKLGFLWRVKLDHAEQLADENPSNAGIQSRYERLRDARFVNRIAEEYKRGSEKLRITADQNIPADAIFEGAQGVLLDVVHGFIPHVTKTDTTFGNAYRLVGANQAIKKLGVLRAYSTRHGAGPFVSEDDDLASVMPDVHNGLHEWQGKFRIGWLDLVASRYALKSIGGVDGIAVTNLDRLRGRERIQVCTAYEYCGHEDADEFFDYETKNGRVLVQGIKAEDAAAPERQEALTMRLLNCKPVYTIIRGDENEYLSFLESGEGLATPIALVSTGPESKEKRFVRAI